MPVLVAGEDGSPRCTTCGRCATACPSRCIGIEAPAEAAALGRPPDRFEIDMGRCTFCGFCEEVCPVGAIVMSPLFELASADPADLRYDLERLLVPADLLTRRLELLARAEPAAGTEA